MCYTAILPTIAEGATVSEELMQITYIFNRWMKMLTNYGKLDESRINEDCSVIARFIKSEGIERRLRRAAERCRNAAVSDSNAEYLLDVLRFTLDMLCEAQENAEISAIKKAYADQGMTERYRPLTRRLAREKIRKLGKGLNYTDLYVDDSATCKLVRRFVEKRAAQAVYKYSGSRDRSGNRFRQSVRRAVSFSLYNKRFTDYDLAMRQSNTHWKVVVRAGERKLLAKHCYKTFEEAQEAANRLVAKYPDDPRPVSAYKCPRCGKWHIGHTRPELIPEDGIQIAG